MSFFGKLFGTDKAIEGVVKSVTAGLDALVYTDEEKATDAAHERSQARSMVVQWMQSTSGQNLARRLIALSLTLMWGTIHGVKTVLAAIAPWFPDKADQIMLSVKALEDSTTQLNGAMMLILAFYFAAPHMGSIVKGALDKFGKKNG